jgi:branched-chain amino acid transport system substrate-binding protein
MVNEGTSHPGRRSPETVGEANDTTERKTNFDRRRFLRTAGVGVAGVGLAGRVGAAANQDSVTIGVLAPEPGQNPIGASMANSAELAAEELNGNGGIGGATVDVSVKDTQEDPSVGKR